MPVVSGSMLLPSNSLSQTRFLRDFPRSAFPDILESGTDYYLLRALAAHLCGPGSYSGVEAICGSLLLVFSFAARGFYPGTPIFQFAICTSPTIHLVCFPSKLGELCVELLLGITVVPRENDDTAYAKFWGQTRCIM